MKIYFRNWGLRLTTIHGEKQELIFKLRNNNTLGKTNSKIEYLSMF